MASSTVPNHDFAPAWLKIPTNASRPSGAISGDSSSSLFHREDSPCSINSHLSSKSRNSSLEQPRDKGRFAFSYRHHSIDTDDPQRHSPTRRSGNDYRLSPNQRQQSGSQPSLDWRPLSRQDVRDNTSPNISSGPKGFSAYDKPESHRSNNSHWGRQRSFERNRGNGGGQNSSGENHASKKDAHKWKANEKVNKFDQEFPLLKGDSTDGCSMVTTATNGSVWDVTKSGKIHVSSSVNKKLYLIQKPIRNDAKKRNTSPSGGTSNLSVGGSPRSVSRAAAMKPAKKSSSNSTANNTTTSVYRTLTPGKGTVIMKPCKEGLKSSGQSCKLNPLITPTSDILNTRLVTHPKNLGNKSDFLRELRDDRGLFEKSTIARVKVGNDLVALENNEGGVGEDGKEVEGSQHILMEQSQYTKSLSEVQNGSVNHDEVDTEECIKMQQSFNGMNIGQTKNEVHEDTRVLSRSLEAEQRLLREMGWKEEGSEDEGVYAPLTEDEMKEFENLSKMIPKRNGLPRNAQFTWSPKRVLAYPSALDLENESSDSSTSDSDSD